MAYGDPVLQRSMFRGPSVQPSVGLGSGTSADENAQALRNMFSPTVSINEPAAMIQQEQQPVQSFRGGGEVINGVKHFQEGGLNLVDQSGVFPGTEMISRFPGAEVSPRATFGLGALRDAFLRSRGVREPTVFPQEGEMPPQIPGRVYNLPEATDIPSAPVVNPALAEQQAVPGQAASPARATERPKGALELTLEGIRAERARSADDKRQNALLALMQAGLAMAGGRSPNAISNIAAGGQAGIAAFAGMEKDRRAEQAGLRREETALLMERERMRAQEERAPEAIRTYASLGGWDPSKGREGFDEAVRKGIQVSKSLEKEPETVRLFQALGGGDLMRGFEIYNSDKKLQAAQAILKDITATEDDKKAANDYIRGQLMRARTGGGGFAGFSATPVR